MRSLFHRSASGQASINRRRGQTFIGLLVVLVIAIGMSMLFIGSRTDSKGRHQKSIARASMDMARNVGTTQYTRQIKMAVDGYREDHGSYPPTLDALKQSAQAKGYSAIMWVGQVDGRPLQYDPNTGQVYPQSMDVPAPITPGSVPLAPAAQSPSRSGSQLAPMAPLSQPTTSAVAPSQRGGIPDEEPRIE